MRNTRQYPITPDEKLAVLDRCAELLAADVGDRVGGVEQLALELVRKDLSRAYLAADWLIRAGTLLHNPTAEGAVFVQLPNGTQVTGPVVDLLHKMVQSMVKAGRFIMGEKDQ